MWGFTHDLESKNNNNHGGVHKLNLLLLEHIAFTYLFCSQ